MNLSHFLLLDESISKCYKRARWIIWQRKSSFLKCFSAIRLIWAHHRKVYSIWPKQLVLGQKKNVSKARGIVESKYTFKRVSFLYSVPQTCYIASSCWSRAAKSNVLSPLTVAYPHILLFLIYSFSKSLKSTEFLYREEIFDTSYALLAYTLKARKYHHYLHHKHL